MMFERQRIENIADELQLSCVNGRVKKAYLEGKISKGKLAEVCPRGYGDMLCLKLSQCELDTKDLEMQQKYGKELNV